MNALKKLLCCTMLLSTVSCTLQKNDHSALPSAHNSSQHSIHNHSSSKNSAPMKVQKPNRKSYSYQQVIHGSIDKIMPLYCPVRELDWCENWQPNIVISNSGIVEKDCIFTTNHGDLEVVWVVTEYDIAKGLVEMYYHVPKTLITKLSIQVQSIDEQTSQARLTYTKTALSPSGDKVLEKFTKEGYDIMMDSWEKAMNHYLKTGEMLTGLPNF